MVLLVLPTTNETFAGGIANLKPAFSHTKTKLTRTGSLNFSAAGLPAAKTYGIFVNEPDMGRVISNPTGMVVIASSTLATTRNSEGLTVIAGKDIAAKNIDFFNLRSITLVDQATGEAALWVAF